jgi:hypothetical protein
MPRGPKKKQEKLCTGCNQILPRSEFYERSNGEIVSRCKKCSSRIAYSWAKSNPEKRKASKKRYYLNGGKEVSNIALRRNRAKNPELYGNINKAWIARNRDRVNASNRAGRKVREAISRGLMTKSDVCQKCGKTNCKIEASHSDYSKPLEVLWLCVSCHRTIDTRNPKTTEGMCGL